MHPFFQFFKELFQTNGFMPRWVCGRWTEAHGWLYILSNVVIGLSYFAIPVMLFVFVKKKKNVPFKGVFLLFSLFIIFCGVTHILDAIMFWVPIYRLNAVMLFLTAITSAVTVFVLYKKLPLALNLKSPEQLQKIIDEQTADLVLANQKLMDSEAQFKALVNNNPDIITLMDSKLRYKFVNESLSKFSNESLSSYIGKTPFEVLPNHPHTGAFTSKLQYVLATGNKVQYEVEATVGKVGEAFFSVDMIPLTNKFNHVNEVITITKNITTIRQNEKKLYDTINKLEQFSMRLEHKRNALQDFTYIVSHNLRSPTGNLISLIDLYNRTIGAEKKELLLSKIFDVSHQLGNTVHDLGEVLNINHNTDLKTELLSFKTVVDNQVKNLAAQIMVSDAAISCDFAACETIIYPKVYLESIILNLLSNALKYAGENRKLVILLKTAVNEKGVISFTCSDNGMGIDLTKYRKKIFSLHKTFHGNPDARGVGLFITKNQINSMGGSITVESEPEKGASFIIHFNEIELL